MKTSSVLFKILPVLTLKRTAKIFPFQKLPRAALESHRREVTSSNVWPQSMKKKAKKRANIVGSILGRILGCSRTDVATKKGEE